MYNKNENEQLSLLLIIINNNIIVSLQLVNNKVSIRII